LNINPNDLIISYSYIVQTSNTNNHNDVNKTELKSKTCSHGANSIAVQIEVVRDWSDLNSHFCDVRPDIEVVLASRHFENRQDNFSLKKHFQSVMVSREISVEKQ
jgi:hypothetical protein